MALVWLCRGFEWALSGGGLRVELFNG